MKNISILKIVLIVMLVITVALVIAAAASGGAPSVIGLNIIWGYILAGAAVAAALFCAGFGMFNAPAGIKATLISVGIVVVVVAISYLVASSNDITIANIGDGGVFDRGETVVTEASVLVTYVTLIAVIVAALGSELMGVIEGFKK